MKQLICPSCAAVLQRPQNQGDCTVTCPLCGRSFQMTRRKGSNPNIPAAKSAIAAPTHPLFSPAAPQIKVRQTTPPIQPQPSPLAPEPAAASSHRWIAASILLMLILGFVGCVVFLMRSLTDESPTGEALTSAKAADSQTPPVPASRNEEPPIEEPEAPEDATGAVRELQMREIVRINARGDGAFVRTYRFPMSAFTKVKTAFANSNLLRRELGFRQHWQEIQDFRVEFDDAASALRLRWRVRGLARSVEEGQWIMAAPQEAGLNLVSHRGNEAILTGKVDLEFGSETLVTRIVRGPPDSSDMQLRSDRQLRFRMAAPSATDAGEAGTPRFVLEAKPRLLACLGQVYAQPKFTRFWTARCVFQNTSGQTLHDYSVRFRMMGYTSDAKGFSCPLVLPGQTVVDAYFPLLDFKQLVELTDATPVPLEVEYQYRQADGRMVRKTETRTVQLLSRNQVLYSSLPPAECLDSHDHHDDTPFILAAMVTKDDKVIEEAAGRIARLVNGANASADTKDAMKFMHGVYLFLSAYIRYQTPPSDLFDGSFSQTVMYGRDVLNKKAGTCIDLAILYASICRAVGLKARLIVTKNHCFPLIVLPQPLSITLTDRAGNKRQMRLEVLAVETTMIGQANFDAAWQRGTLDEFSTLQQEGGILARVNIHSLQARGVRSLPFPAATLKDLGIRDDDERWARLMSGSSSRPTVQGNSPRSGRSSGGSGDGGFMPKTRPQPERSVAAPVGAWFAHGRLPDGSAYEYTLTLGKDGSYKLQQKLVKRMPRGGAGVPIEQEIIGTYKVGQEAIVFTTDNKEKQVCEYSLRGTRLFISMPHAQYGRVHFNFVKLPD